MVPSGSLVLRKLFWWSLPFPAYTLRLVNKSPSHIPQVFFKLLLLCLSRENGYCAVSLTVATQFPVNFYFSQRQAGWFLKFQVFSPTDCKKLWCYVTLVFKAECYGYISSYCIYPMLGVTCVGSDPLPSPCLRPPFSFQTVPWDSSSPNYISALTYLSNVASLHLAVDSLSYQCFGHFLEYLYRCVCLRGSWDGMSLGSSYFSIFPGSSNFHECF